MRIKMLNGEAEAKLRILAEWTKEKTTLPCVIGYKINANICALENALEPFIRTKDKIISDISGGKTVINQKDNPEQYAQVINEINKIALEETEFDVKTIKLDDISELSLPFNLMSALYFMIEEE